MDFLIVVDMQNDFIDGALGTPEALAIVPKVAEKIKDFGGKGNLHPRHPRRGLPRHAGGQAAAVKHCIKGTDGWQIRAELEALGAEDVIDKPAFGSPELAMQLKNYDETVEHIGSVTLVGLCTDICVISNAMLIKAFMPEAKVTVDAACCAGVTPESHKRALESMKTCQIGIVND